MLDFRIDRRSGVPVYLQIVQQTRQALLLGRLAVGDQLPTAREVVSHTGINPNTVLKAYRELERTGLVQARAGAGTFVTDTLRRTRDTPVGEVAGAALEAWLRGARKSGLDRQEIEALFKAALDQEYGGPEGVR